LNVLNTILRNAQISDFMQVRPGRAKLFRVDGQVDRQTWRGCSCCLQFCWYACKVGLHWSIYSALFPGRFV